MTLDSSFIPLLREISRADSPIGATYLCNLLEQSQATIGRQLIYLENNGLVKKVSNKGRVVTQKGLDMLRQHDENDSKTKLADELVRLSFSTDARTLLEIMSVREMLEQRTAQEAARLATERDIIILENYAFAHRYKIANNMPGAQEALGFHLEIARIAGNDTLNKILALLLTGEDILPAFARVMADETDLVVRGHFAILNAIRDKQPEVARAAMEEHLLEVSKRVDKN